VLSLYTTDEAQGSLVYCMTTLTISNFLANIRAVDLLLRDPALAFCCGRSVSLRHYHSYSSISPSCGRHSGLENPLKLQD